MFCARVTSLHGFGVARESCNTGARVCVVPRSREDARALRQSKLVMQRQPGKTMQKRENAGQAGRRGQSPPWLQKSKK